MTIEQIRAERLRLVERLRPLSDDDWARPSLCEGWTVKDALAHIVTPFSVSMPRMALAFVRHRGPDRALFATARNIAADQTPEQLLATLENNAGSKFRPPGLPLEAPLTDIVAHSADIRWALGDPVADWADSERLIAVLDLITSRAGRSFVAAARLKNLSLVATDVTWTYGEGDAVRGPALHLVMALLGRELALGGLEGDGLAHLQLRLDNKPS